jgi:hypothetical protein
MRRSYEGAAQAAKLVSPLGGSTADQTIFCDNLTNWPTGVSDRPFFVVIDRGKSSEEKILCASRSGNTLTVYDNGIVNGRAADDTSITAHSTNAVIEHVFTATDADEANAHVNNTTSAHGLTIADVITVSNTKTLANKTISSSNNTLTVSQASVTNLTTDLAAKFPLNVSTSAQTASYTLVLADAQKVVEMNVSTANTLTIPLDSSVNFPVGTSIFVVQTGAGQTTIAGASGVTVNSFIGLKIIGRWAGATLIKRATNTWVAVGGLVA